ncbi:hypothetical protein EDB86DRAFT_3118912 [Lactarius hatsudake]|nr:hypothetical protein EDB86DRAFT_3118912 [Lactarius hatsudake]
MVAHASARRETSLQRAGEHKGASYTELKSPKSRAGRSWGEVCEGTGENERELARETGVDSGCLEDVTFGEGASLESGKCHSKAAKGARAGHRGTRNVAQRCETPGNTKEGEQTLQSSEAQRGELRLTGIGRDNIKPKGQPSEAVKPLAEGWKGSQASQGLTCQSARTSDSADARECADCQNATRTLDVLADNEVTKAEGTRAIESARGRCGGQHRWWLGQGGQAAQDHRQRGSAQADSWCTDNTQTTSTQRANSADSAMTMHRRRENPCTDGSTRAGTGCRQEERWDTGGRHSVGEDGGARGSEKATKEAVAPMGPRVQMAGS